MKTDNLLWCLLFVFGLATPFDEASAQSKPQGKSAASHSSGSSVAAGPQSRVVKEMLSSPLEFHQIIKREEAVLMRAQLRLQPNDADLLLKTAKALKFSSQFGALDEQAWFDAKEMLLKCVRIFPTNVTAWFSLGNWHLNELDFKQARQCFEKAKTLGAKNEDVEFAFQGLEKAEAFHKDETGRPVPPRKRIRPNEQASHKLRPIDEQELSDKSRSLLQRLEANPRDAKSWHELGKSLAHEESLPSASMKVATYHCLVKAKQHDSKNIEARESLVEVYRKNGAVELMKEECRQLLRVDPSNARAIFLLGIYGDK